MPKAGEQVRLPTKNAGFRRALEVGEGRLSLLSPCQEKINNDNRHDDKTDPSPQPSIHDGNKAETPVGAALAGEGPGLDECPYALLQEEGVALRPRN